MAALNEALAAADGRDDARRIGSRAETVGDAAQREQPLLRPLPVEDFDVAATLSCRVDAKARVCVRQSYYSVPAHYAGRRLEVRLGATTIRILDPGAAGKVVATHTRSLHKGSEDLVLDHYLEVLTRKPGALAGATALVAARASGAFTPAHQRFWDAARRRLGDGPGTRALVGVLLLHRTMPAAAVIAGIEAALAIPSCSTRRGGGRGTPLDARPRPSRPRCLCPPPCRRRWPPWPGTNDPPRPWLTTTTSSTTTCWTTTS